MARPKKEGLDYFPLDVDFFEDEKILAISGEFAVKGEIIVLRLLCEIYRNGYFVEYSGLLKNKLARLGGLTPGLVDGVVRRLLEYGFFNESLFREHNILTSKAIQSRYATATKRRDNSTSLPFWLQDGVNVYINPPSMGVNADIYPETKPNKTKPKKNKPNGDFSFGDEWDLLLEKWKSLEGSSVRAEPVPDWLIVPQAVVNDFLRRRDEYGIEKMLAFVDLVRNSLYWQKRTIGLPKFLREETFLKLLDGSYDWNPDKPPGKAKPDKSVGVATHPDNDVKYTSKWDTSKAY